MVVVTLVVLALLIWLLVRLLSLGLEGGYHPVRSLRAWQAWSILRVLDEARTWLFPLYSSSLTPAWLRALGARVGSDVEASTVLLIPTLTTVSDGAFLADDTLIGGYELGGGWLRIERVKVGKHAFVGNSGMTAPGRKVPEARPGRRAVGGTATEARQERHVVDRQPTDQAAPGHQASRRQPHLPPTDPAPARPRRRRAPAAGPGDPQRRHRTRRRRHASWRSRHRPAGRRWPLLSGVVLIVAGAVAAAVTTAAKWLLVGRLTVSDHPLWSSFVWRNELADTFVEVIAAPWFARAATGTPVLNVWLRSMGAKIGKGVWCETYWLPEADLVDLRDGATINRGCVVQTHLFHDRMLSMDRVTLRAGATLGPEQRDPPGSRARPARYRRTGVPGDERRGRARQDPLDRQSHRPLDRGRSPGRCAMRLRSDGRRQRLLPGQRRPDVRRAAATT